MSKSAEVREQGFSLMELLIAIAVAGILFAIAAMPFSRMNRKSLVEAQLKKIYTDFTEVRSEAMYRKQARAITFTAGSYSVYSSAVTAVPPLRTTTVKNPLVALDTDPVVFDENGLLLNGATVTRVLCISTGAENGAIVDSLVISLARIQQGKWQVPEGAANACTETNIVFK